MGAGIAYRLALRGASDVVLCDRGEVCSGSTARALGGVRQQFSTAAEVTKMMEAVVNEGTGVTAKIPGIQVAGKTGTAEIVQGQSTNNAWFIAFAPASKPTVAVAATVAGVPGYGATFAAPVAKQVMEALLR